MWQWRQQQVYPKLAAPLPFAWSVLPEESTPARQPARLFHLDS